MIIVTGGAGFIGSCIVATLNAQGADDIVIVDHLEGNRVKERNLTGKRYMDYYDKSDFLDIILRDKFEHKVSHIVHMGACSSTTLDDADYYEKNNFEYTRHLCEWCLKKGVKFIYASSAATYGNGSLGYKDDLNTIRGAVPLNLYGNSKKKFDVWVLDNCLFGKVVGLRFFNVYGPNEYHKGEMRSVIAKAYNKVVKEGRISLFKSYLPEYKDGEQKRDFIYVKDAVNVVMYFIEHPDVGGIFNVGTGRASTWNEVAEAIFEAAGKKLNIEYIEMPQYLRDKYQYYTKADIDNLRLCGYMDKFTPLKDAVKDYAQYLSASSCL